MQGEGEIVGGLIVSCIVWPWIAVLVIACNTEAYKLIKPRPLGSVVHQHGTVYIELEPVKGVRIWRDQESR